MQPKTLIVMTRREPMRNLLISLPECLFQELKLAAADCGELDEPEVMTPEIFARECIEAALATRRLERITAPPAQLKRAPRRDPFPTISAELSQMRV
jgi:hypothetical protein